MVKKYLLVAFLVLVSCLIQAQNIQLHYDFGENRKYLTSTVELFKPDKFGSTFFFIDMNYGADGIKGVSLGYWELSRSIKFWDKPFAFHAEFNGGAGIYQSGDFTGGYEIRSSWLGGVEYSVNAKDFSKGFTIQALYKYIRGKHDASFQLTGVWFINCLENKISFKGYADFWREDKIFDAAKTRFVFQSEPQLWYNFNKNFAFGGEIEIGYNFKEKGCKFNPTLGIKATF